MPDTKANKIGVEDLRVPPMPPTRSPTGPWQHVSLYLQNELLRLANAQGNEISGINVFLQENHPTGLVRWGWHQLFDRNK